MTKPAATYTHWFIFDGVGAVDGEMFTDYQRLLMAVGWQDAADYVVCAFDLGLPGQLGNWTHKGETQLVDVTKEVAADWWESRWNDSFEKVRAGQADFCFLAQHHRKELDAFIADHFAVENAADAWRDERVAAE
ncbi:hypothetical protein WH87_04980 [Devosia epidermidihirudinis]|uniref:Uncharacterized protein n=1 Tax=Devosia epidermidihirudinis TaxID=1293439 RepID=A0A0F5QFP3_9HYPH|nr:hypothetical protein [Devosia epidermidihirudinis]KKC39546.1 hypothetical protein WH87_04980 [Devosia epidermidihirudinis]